MKENKNNIIIPIGTSIIGFILAIISYVFYEPNIVVSGCIFILGMLIGLKIIRRKGV